MIRVAPAHADPLDWEEWRTPLQQFSQACALVVSAYEIDGQRAGQRKIGPLLATRTARFLAQSSLWRDDGPGTAFEQRVVALVAAGHDDVTERYHDLQVAALPLTRGGQRYGALVFGWCFADFSSPMACQRLGAEIGVAGQALWNEVRLDAPLTSARLDTYRELLRTLAGSIDRQRDTIDELKRVSRTRELFLATVSHEMRTPLSALSMRVEILLRTMQDMPPALKTALLSMRVHVRQEAAMVEDLIDAARTLTGTMSVERVATPLGRVVREAVSTVEGSVSAKRIAFSVAPDNHGDHIEVYADPRRLQQVLWNLILNAVKFTPEGGAVGVTISQEADGVCIRVSDSGQGIAPDDLAHVFGAFTLQSEANASGLGLGLYIARRIVELHGGSITASSPGKGLGATFTVYLPTERGAIERERRSD
ncbi:sensor histidine kinase [Janthinobacterium aquaticum]|uniref:sensor histidine kinase n=1 Tax=Janthinobacterium sp. FT58W TaxID=2654254 RepID=UPI001264BF1B|nr:HAMP domain-containing sensor histidine kinase [Janthinobacterium sp. FT58W]KAB8038232.1 hypothetical protein GCM43_23175 [Janthinobacterium sp. FT58W]